MKILLTAALVAGGMALPLPAGAQTIPPDPFFYYEFLGLTGNATNFGLAISPNGTVAGYTRVSSIEITGNAFIFTDRLAGFDSPFGLGVGRGVNDAGLVVGTANYSSNSNKAAVRFSLSATAEFFPFLPGADPNASAEG